MTDSNMTDTSSNKAPSDDDKQAITDGANWLAQWMTERYNQGVLSKAEYNKAINNLKNIKVYTTDKGYDRLLEALENGELHFNEAATKRIAKAYDRKHPFQGMLSAKDSKKLADFGISFGDADLTDEQKSIAFFKEYVENNPSSTGLLGFHLSDIKEPVVFLNVDKLKESSGEVGCPTLTSLAIHEMTHNLKLDMQEDMVMSILKGVKYTNNPKPQGVKATAPTITPEFIAESDTEIPLHKGKKERSTDNENNIILKDGVEFDSYLDSSEEIYARLMQLRYDFGLKPDETFTKEQIDEIERRAQIAKEQFENGESTNKADIDFNIVKRYRNGMIRDMLNYTAEEKTDVKSTMKVQEWQSNRDMAKNTPPAPEKNAPQKEENKATNTPPLVKPNTHDMA